MQAFYEVGVEALKNAEVLDTYAADVLRHDLCAWFTTWSSTASVVTSTGLYTTWVRRMLLLLLTFDNYAIPTLQHMVLTLGVIV